MTAFGPPPPVEEQIAATQHPCVHQHHLACIEAVEQRGEPPCPCYAAGQGGEQVDFSKREPFTGTGIGRH